MNTTILSEAVATLDNYRTAVAAAGAARHALDKLTDTPRVDLAATVLDEITETGAVNIERLRKLAVESTVAATVDAEIRAALANTAARLASDIGATLRGTAVDPALAHLAERLAEIVNRVQACHEALGDARTIEAAVAAGTADAWLAIMKSADEYVAVREAQRAIVAASMDTSPMHLGHPLAPGIVHPTASHAARQRVDSVGLYNAKLPEPESAMSASAWPGFDPTLREPMRSTTPVEFLRWLVVESDLDVIVPTIGEMADAAEAAAVVEPKRQRHAHSSAHRNGVEWVAARNADAR